MAVYEFTFETLPITEAQEDYLTDELDATLSRRAGVATVTLSAEGASARSAAAAVIEQMASHGIRSVRLMDDLVGRAEIARRLGVTPQAVGNWCRGDRRGDVPFPKPYVLGTSELWLWGEVVAARRACGDKVDQGMSYPTRRDIQLIGGDLAAGASEEGWTSR